ncbi:MAG: hypothetical protein HYR85_03955, partial [Planctomycetes bacterium]|nr:hypothetical protein [Planctomycetota bacterium]
VFDDGTGPALYAGGLFHRADGHPAIGVAKWDGNAWSAVGQPTTNGRVIRLAVFDDGTGPALYASGGALGPSSSSVARWNGSTWTSLPTLGRSLALAVFDAGSGPALYAVGGAASGPHRVVRWDAGSWTTVGNFTGPIYALAPVDDGVHRQLIAAGFFSIAGHSFIAAWDGTVWSGFEGGAEQPNGAVYTVTAFALSGHLDLFAAGFFGEHIARWNGSAWSALGPGFTGWPYALIGHDDGTGPALYVGGSFFVLDEANVDNVIRWNGSGWSTLGAGLTQDSFPSVDALCRYDDGTATALYAGGGFDRSGARAVHGIARWSGSEWLPVGDPVEGVSGSVKAMTTMVNGGRSVLLVAGDFSSAGGIATQSIARWDGTSWSAMGAATFATSAQLTSVAVHDDGNGATAFAAGYYRTPVDRQDGYVARWDGSAWNPIGHVAGISEDPPIVKALASFDDGSGPALYAAGDFMSIDGVAANHVARWRNNTWSAVGTSVPGGGFPGVTVVDALTVFDDGSGAALYASGGFHMAEDHPADTIARWSGSEWSTLGTGLRGGECLSLTSFDDGSGPALFAGGRFLLADGVASSTIARWTPGSPSTPGSSRVGFAGGIATDVLFVNESAGGASRTVVGSVGQPISVRLDAAPAGPSRAAYALWLWRGAVASTAEVVVSGVRLGCAVAPTPFAIAAAPQPFQCRRGGLGPEFAAGVAASYMTPARAPWSLARASGLSAPVVFTLQGVLADGHASNALGLSLTNAVTLRVAP